MAKKKAAAPAPREIVASYQVRITLHKRMDHDQTQWGKTGDPPPEPTVDEIVRAVQRGLYGEIEYFTMRQIGIGGERTDK